MIGLRATVNEISAIFSSCFGRFSCANNYVVLFSVGANSSDLTLGHILQGTSSGHDGHNVLLGKVRSVKKPASFSLSCSSPYISGTSLMLGNGRKLCRCQLNLVCNSWEG